MESLRPFPATSDDFAAMVRLLTRHGRLTYSEMMAAPAWLVLRIYRDTIDDLERAIGPPTTAPETRDDYLFGMMPD